MFCEECGKKLPEGARFCENCGAPVNLMGDGGYAPEEPYGETGQEPYREQERYREEQNSYRKEPYIEEQFRNPYNMPEDRPSGKQKKGSGSTIAIVILSIVAAVLLAALIILGIRYFKGQNSKNSDPVKQPWEAAEEETTTEEASEETEASEAETEKRYESLASGAAESSQETTGNAAEQEYILPGSNTAYLTEADLAGLTKEELRLARNELYARHGRKFKDESLNQYFSAKSWYHPSIEPDQFNESVFNEYEIANRKLIADYEKKMGY